MTKLTNIGMLYIRDNTQLPSDFALTSEPFLPGWRVLQNTDRQQLTAQIEASNWNFFYLAGEIRATEFGTPGPATFRRLVRRIVKQQASLEFQFNFLELIQVTSKRFLGIPYTSVIAHSRHIQPGMRLMVGKDLATPAFRISAANPRPQDLGTRQDPVLVSGSL